MCIRDRLATDPDESIHFDWTPYLEPDMTKSYPTAVSNESLKETMKTVLAFDKDFLMQKQVGKLYEERNHMLSGDLPLNWGFAEMAAYATLLKDGFPVRVTGQDSRRGTFSHRHLVVKDQNTGEGFVPLLSLIHI